MSRHTECVDLFLTGQPQMNACHPSAPVGLLFLTRNKPYCICKAKSQQGISITCEIWACPPCRGLYVECNYFYYHYCYYYHYYFEITCVIVALNVSNASSVAAQHCEKTKKSLLARDLLSCVWETHRLSRQTHSQRHDKEKSTRYELSHL